MLSRVSTRGMINIATFSGHFGIWKTRRSKYRRTLVVSHHVAQGFYDLFGCRLPFPGPVSSGTRYHASYVRTETTNLTTSDAPSGADLLGHPLDSTRRKREEFPEEREFRLFGFTENGAHFHLSFRIFGNW